MASLRKTQESPEKRIARGARAVTVAVFLSRVLGLVREQALAMLFGAGFQMDAYVVAYRIPNLLRDLLAEGALASAFVTVFTQHKEKYGLEATWQVVQRALGTILWVVLGIVLIGEFLAPYLVSLLAPGFAPESKKELAVLLTRIMFPFLACVSISAVFAGILNALGVFFLPAVSSALFNLVSVTVGVSLYFWLRSTGYPPIVGMAAGVVLGGLSQALIQLPALKRRGFRFRVSFAPHDPVLREIFRLMVPMVLGLSAIQLSVFINTYFASFCGEGALSWLSYAFRLMYVPLGLFGVALSVAVLPVVSAQVAQGQLKQLKNTYASSLLMALALALPSATGLVMLAQPIVRLIFEHGRFGPQDTLHTAQALALFSLALPAYAATKVTTPVFYALRRPKIPMVSSFLSVGINFLVVLLTLKRLNFRAIALGTTTGIVAQAIFQVGVLNHLLKGINWPQLVSGTLRLLLATTIMGAGALVGKSYLASLEGLQFLGGTLALIAGCGLLYFLVAGLLGPEEALYLLRFFKRRP